MRTSINHSLECFQHFTGSAADILGLIKEQNTQLKKENSNLKRNNDALRLLIVQASDK